MSSLISGVYGLVEGSLIQELRFENVANNLSNINTTAFKRDIISFNQVLSMEYATEPDFTPGPMRRTGNPLDTALQGRGFFKIQTAQGIRYTQSGAFTLSPDRFLATQNGDPVLGENGPIRIQGKQVLIGSHGQVLVDGEGVDRILVVDFTQPELLRKEGASYFSYQGEAQDIYPARDVTLHQGYIEGSNVEPTAEMIEMMDALRAFESAQKAIQSVDEMTGKLINDPGLLQ